MLALLNSWFCAVLCILGGAHWKGMLHQLQTRCKHSWRAVFLKTSSHLSFYVILYFATTNVVEQVVIEIQWQSCREASKVIKGTSAGCPLGQKFFELSI